MKKKKVFLILFWFFYIIFSECIYKMTLFKNIIDPDFWQMICFCLPIATILYFFTTLFGKKFNKVLTTLVVCFIYFIFFAQMVYFQVYNDVFSVYSLTNGGQVLEFWRTIVSTVISSFYNYFCLTVPLVIYFVCMNKLFDFSSNNLKIKSLNVAIFFVFSSICLIFLGNDKKAIYGSYNLYFNTHAPILSAKKFGLINTMIIDLDRALLGMNVKTIEIVSSNDEPKEELLEKEYNKLDIDFDSLIENEDDEVINSLHNYFKALSGTAKNEYTGMFKDKNVVFFLAESFDPIAISEDLTPTLYKLSTSGFNFTNYYAPLYPASTADGEFRTEWSLISSRGDTLTLYSAKNVYSPYIFVNSFNDYDIHIYHNYSGDYYNRRTYFKSLGYQNFKSCFYGLNMTCGSFHESDLDMVKSSIDEYINNEEKFFAYYITLSGHLAYNKSVNKIAQKNWDLVKDLEYSDKVKGYIASNIELDRALEYLIQKLEESSKLDDTVIILTADHYPYGLSNDAINEVSEYNRDDVFELYHSDLIIWNSVMEKVEINKVGSNTDVLPTMLNLFGKDYDSRMIVGSDLLSPGEGLVVLSDRSWMTDSVKYNAILDEAKYVTKTGSVIYAKDDEVELEDDSPAITVDELYVEKYNNLVDNQFKISDLILKSNYYDKVFNNKSEEVD